MLNKIIMHEGLVIDQNLQPKCGFLNKRNKNNNVGNGIYLSPNISIVEQKTGIVFLDDKAYKIALMARVLSDKMAATVQYVPLSSVITSLTVALDSRAETGTAQQLKSSTHKASISHR